MNKVKTPKYAILYKGTKPNERRVRVLSYWGNGMWQVLDGDIKRLVNKNVLTFIK